MDSLKGETFLVTGATGCPGSVVVRHLLPEGVHVKALTRDPYSKKAKQLRALGTEDERQVEDSRHGSVHRLRKNRMPLR